jgi:hypothetical protein
MNELIQKLAEESGLDARTMGVTHTAQWNARVTKLAELIIRECANVAADHDALDIYEEIREHFGVEE